MVVMFGKFLLVLALFCLALTNIQAATDKIICYYASWGANRVGNGRFTPENIQADLCTHVNYAFLGLNDNGTLLILDEKTDIQDGNLKKVSDLKKINPNLKTIFSIGGYAAGTAVFTAVSSDPQKRANLAASAIEFCQKFNYDGIDIDWEYPLTGDRVNYITLFKDIKKAFEPYGYIVTTAVAYNPVDAAYDVPSMSKVVDIINVMTYDYHSSWAGAALHHSPLYCSSSEGEWQRDNLNANSSITHWILSGADPQKLSVGIAFYGHAMNLVNPSNYQPGAPTAGPADKGPFTENSGTLGYNEICEFHKNAEKLWDNERQVPYAHDGKLWVGYDDPKSVALKANLAKEKNLAGVMIWSIETDDSHGLCGEPYGLLKAIRRNM